MVDTSRFVRFERVDEVTRTATGLEARLHGERLRLDLVADDVLRVAVSRAGAFDEAPTPSVCVDPLASAVAGELQQDDDAVRLVTGAMVVTLWLDPFRLDVHRTDGTPVVETAQDDDGRWWAYATLNDAFTVRRRCRREDGFLGLGEKTGPHDRKGRDYVLWNTDVLSDDATEEFRRGRAPDDPRGDNESTDFDPYYVSIPFLHHVRYPSGVASASFVDNGYRGAYDLTRPGEYAFTFSGGQYTEYVFAGPRIPDVLRAYTALTGRAPLPPLWALGYHQCRWFRYTQDAVERLGREHRERGVPCDALWLDIDHMDGYRVFTWDAESFPDVPGMLARLAEQGIRLVTIVDPGVKYEPGYGIYDSAVERDVLCRTEGGDHYIGQVWPGRTVFPDFATPEARAWWGELNAAHVRSGVAGIWNDMNEPATGAIPPAAMRFDRGRASHERFHNSYALLMAMATTEGLRDALPDQRTFVLSRAGSAGIQRYAANWMGDNLSRWDHLAMSIPMAMGFGLSGQPFVGADVGGFHGDTSAELFLRWMQYGALTPFFRNHSEEGNVDQYAWSFGPAVEHVVREAVRLRYRLLPYLYAAFVEASESGMPVQRPLVLEHQGDRATLDVDDQFLLGPHLLVAPVVEPGVTARQVYLPAGDWYDWHGDEPVRGERYVVATTPVERIPLYVRAGAVVPMWEQAPASAGGHQPRVVQLHAYVPVVDGGCSSLLQEDDGATVAALDGACCRTSLRLERVGQRVTLQGEVTGDGYPELAREAFHLVVHGAAPSSVLLDGEQVTPTGDHFVLPNRGSGFTVQWDV